MSNWGKKDSGKHWARRLDDGTSRQPWVCWEEESSSHDAKQSGLCSRGHNGGQRPATSRYLNPTSTVGTLTDCQSTNGGRWIHITGRTQLTNAFDSVSFKRPGSSLIGSRHTANDAQGARPQSPAGNRLLSALEARRSESPERGRRGGHASRSRTPSRSRSRERARSDMDVSILLRTIQYTHTHSKDTTINACTAGSHNDTVCTVCNENKHVTLEYNVHENNIFIVGDKLLIIICK
jgi:hypothetical protein